MINAFYKKYQKHFDVSENNFAHFVMWSCGGICIGFVIGLVGIAFHLALEWATEFRTAHPMLLWLLPFGGLAIVLAYRLAGQEKDRGTNFILVAVFMVLKLLPVSLLSRQRKVRRVSRLLM